MHASACSCQELYAVALGQSVCAPVWPLSDDGHRVRVQFVSNYLADPGFFNVPLMMRLGLAATPNWLSHMTGNAVMDGDGMLLYGQVCNREFLDLAL